ncbi:MAG: methyltransferase domain-containing protein [Chloroflexota bacterium]
MSTFYAQTMPGIEDIAWLEIKSQLARVKFGEKLFAKDQNGLVLFDYQGDTADLLNLRTTEDLFVLAHMDKKLTKGWDDLYTLTKKIIRSKGFETAVGTLLDLHRTQPQGIDLTYRVISRLHGRFEYRRIDLARSVEKAIKAKYPKWKKVDDKSRIEIWVNALGSRLVIGLRISDRTMRHRFKKKDQKRAALRPSVAAAMVHLTDPQPEDIFLDPMCGSGTILMERRLTNDYGRILGGDIDTQRLLAAQANIRGQRREKARDIEFAHLDAQRLPFHTGSINKMATNLPFGKQIGSKAEVARLYPALFQEFERVLQPGGKAVILSSEFELVKTAVRSCPSLTILTGYSIAVLGQWGRIYIARKE